jgi:hypothetical protein
VLVDNKGSAVAQDMRRKQHTDQSGDAARGGAGGIHRLDRETRDPADMLRTKEPGVFSGSRPTVRCLPLHLLQTLSNARCASTFAGPRFGARDVTRLEIHDPDTGLQWSELTRRHRSLEDRHYR